LTNANGAETTTITLNDINVPLMEDFIFWLYNEEFATPETRVEELFTVAKKYEVEELKVSNWFK
jgi:hypothetical protein